MGAVAACAVSFIVGLLVACLVLGPPPRRPAIGDVRELDANWKQVVANKDETIAAQARNIATLEEHVRLLGGNP